MPFKDPEKAREHDRERYRRLTKERLASGMCPKCGREFLPPERGLCHTCGEKKRKAERARYAKGKAEGRLYGDRDPKDRRRIGRERSRKRLRAHRDAGLCTRCGHRSPVQGGATCRRRYAQRRESWRCTDCGEPSQGAARCVPCAHRSWVRSGQHRGLPILPPRYTVIETATGEDHGTWDSWEEVAMCLAFARLSRDRVEIISDTSLMATFTGQS